MTLAMVGCGDTEPNFDVCSFLEEVLCCGEPCICDAEQGQVFLKIEHSQGQGDLPLVARYRLTFDDEGNLLTVRDVTNDQTDVDDGNSGPVFDSVCVPKTTCFVCSEAVPPGEPQGHFGLCGCDQRFFPEDCHPSRCAEDGEDSLNSGDGLLPVPADI